MMKNVLLFSLVLLISACGNMQEKLKVQNLDKAIDEYAYALRWKRIDDAVSFHRNKDGSKPDINVGPMDDIRVTGFNIENKVLGHDMKDCTVTGELKYYKEDYGMLRTLKFEQHWWYDEEAKRWFVDSPFPEFK